jgi:hypothetical protein
MRGGYSVLIPRYAGGRPSKLSDEQKEQLKIIFKERDNWTTEEVRELIFREFDVEYTPKQIRILLKENTEYFGPRLHSGVASCGSLLTPIVSMLGFRDEHGILREYEIDFVVKIEE